MLAIMRSPPLHVRRVFQYHLRGGPYSLVRDRVSRQSRWGRVKLQDSQTAAFLCSRSIFRHVALDRAGGDNHIYSSSETRKVAIRSNRERWHACISAWVARCDDSLGAAVPLEVSLVRVFPKRGKCVGLAGFCVNASSSRRCTLINLWSRAYRQDMVPGGQHRIVTLTKPQIRNKDTVDEQVEVRESTKIGCPGHSQISGILRMGRAGVRLGLSR